MVESRCGLLCSACDYRDVSHCAGCLAITRPVWGDYCPVKSCCEDRMLSHCGQCEVFPCDVLTRFAYDPEQGDCGRRIERCREWSGSD
jgi:hypothetical protein